MFKEDYEPSFYIHGAIRKVKRLKSDVENKNSVQTSEWNRKKIRLGDDDKSRVLKVNCKSLKALQKLAEEIIEEGKFKEFHLFNVDIRPSQEYLFENGIFPLGKIEIKNLFDPEMDPIDSTSKTRYDLPPLKTIDLKIESEKNRKYENFDRPIQEIGLKTGDREIKISGRREEDKIQELMRLIEKEDPDIIMTQGGDKWDLPYLAKRARANELSEDLILGRENIPLKFKDKEGTSYFSYGRTYYRPPSHHLKGRIHIDAENSFIYQKCGLEGLIELSRISRTPLQETARSSVGSIMTNLQLNEARKMEVLIPWKKRTPEKFKSALKLIKSDRGEFIFEPKTGVHENVGEIDFSSFYPSIMEKYNISPETILCNCCLDSKRRVPELDYNICRRKRGLIPRVLKPILDKRSRYKKLSDESDQSGKNKFEKRQDALKWILVTCFGYLGYRNAKFGRIEAHESVTAYARRKLKKASKIAEKEGFNTIHGIVDSLWVKKDNMETSGLKALCEKIKDETGLPISPEGKYRWIVLLKCREDSYMPATNKYYGLFESGKIKARGISARKDDTPKIVSKAQKDALEILSKCRKRSDLSEETEEILRSIKKYRAKICRGDLNAQDLAVERQLSKAPDAYKRNSRSAIAAKKLESAGVELKAGQKIRYVVTNENSKDPESRVEPLLLFEDGEGYDREWYVDKLMEAMEEILKPLGYDKSNIEYRVLGEKRQEKLKING